MFENTCFICYIIPNLWSKWNIYCFSNSTNYFIYQQMWNIKCLKSNFRDQRYFCSTKKADLFVVWCGL